MCSGHCVARCGLGIMANERIGQLQTIWQPPDFFKGFVGAICLSRQLSPPPEIFDQGYRRRTPCFPGLQNAECTGVHHVTGPLCSNAPRGLGRRAYGVDTGTDDEMVAKNSSQNSVILGGLRRTNVDYGGLKNAEERETQPFADTRQSTQLQGVSSPHTTSLETAINSPYDGCNGRG